METPSIKNCVINNFVKCMDIYITNGEINNILKHALKTNNVDLVYNLFERGAKVMPTFAKYLFKLDNENLISYVIIIVNIANQIR